MEAADAVELLLDFSLDPDLSPEPELELELSLDPDLSLDPESLLDEPLEELAFLPDSRLSVR